MAREVALISEPNVAVVLGKLPAGLRSVSGSGGRVRRGGTGVSPVLSRKGTTYPLRC
jgi:hypothetical protein